MAYPHRRPLLILSFRHADRKGTPAPRRVADGDFAAVGGADFFGNGKPQPKMFFLAAGRVGAVKSVKDFLFLPIGNPDPRVYYLDAQFPTLAKEAQCDFLPSRGIGQGIVQKDGNSLFHPLRVTGAGGILFCLQRRECRDAAPQANLLFGCQGGIFFVDRLQQIRQAERLELEMQVGLLHFHQTEKILDEPFHPGHFFVQQREDARRGISGRAVFEKGQACLKHCQGRAQFMGSKGNEMLLLFVILDKRLEDMGGKGIGKKVQRQYGYKPDGKEADALPADILLEASKAV